MSQRLPAASASAVGPKNFVVKCKEITASRKTPAKFFSVTAKAARKQICVLFNLFLLEVDALRASCRLEAKNPREYKMGECL